MIKEVLRELVKGKCLSYDDAVNVLTEIISGSAPDHLVTAFLTALAMRPVKGEELAGFSFAMRKYALPIYVKSKPVIDTCGMGGDHKGTFNISTAVAFVCAGAGIKVAKHGNRSATSMCGSADVLEHLGVVIDLPPENVAKCIDHIGIGFLFARTFHPAMKNVAKVRSELPFPTIFNMIGPLSNPVSVDAQVLGVFSEDLLDPVAIALKLIGRRRAFIVWGTDGLDEVTPCGDTKIKEVNSGEIREYVVNPSHLGLTPISLEQIKGGTVEQNAEILVKVLSGEHTPYRTAVLINSAPAIIAGGLAHNWKEAISIAEETVNSGKALQKLQQLIDFSKSLAK